MNGILPLARKLGELLQARETIPPIETADKRAYRPRRKDLWTPEQWAEMQRIWNEEPGS